MSGAGLKDCLIKAQKAAYSVRENLGVSHKEVSLVTRTWSGKHPGDGKATDKLTVLDPRPIVKEVAHDIRLLEGGSVKQGDLFIQGLFKDDFPFEADVDAQTKTSDKNIEYFYKVGDFYYTSIHVKERFTTWDVQVRRTVDKRGY